MTPNINENPRSRKTPKRGRKPLFDAAILEERFNTIERVFGWEDKFRRLLQHFDRLSQSHYAFKTLAYALINLRHFCIGYVRPTPPSGDGRVASELRMPIVRSDQAFARTGRRKSVAQSAPHYAA